jgi:hypothetical protein
MSAPDPIGNESGIVAMLCAKISHCYHKISAVREPAGAGHPPRKVIKRAIQSAMVCCR